MKLPPQLPPDSTHNKPKPKSKPKKISKGVLISQLQALMTIEQWELIAQLRGISTPATDKKKESFLNGLFKKRISVSSAKSKGRGLQQWLARKISEFTGLPWGKDEEISSREMGQSGPDIRMSSTARMMFPFTAECKSGNHWNLPAAIKQCRANLYPFTDWLVCLDRPSIHPNERILPIIILSGERFFEIITREALCQTNSTKPSDKK